MRTRDKLSPGSSQEQIIFGEKVRLRGKSLSDAGNDYAWQIDPELARLDAVPPLAIKYSQYFDSYERELRCISSMRRQFAIVTCDGKHIGNCVYYEINESRGETELGIMIGDADYRNRGYGADAVSTLVDYIFNELKFRRVHLKTLETNIRAQRCFMKCGFTPCGRTEREGYKFLLMEIKYNNWRERKQLEPGKDIFSKES